MSDRTMIAVATTIALVAAALLGFRQQLWIPLWITLGGILLCAGESARIRWVRIRRHKRSLRLWREGRISRWSDDVGGGL